MTDMDIVLVELDEEDKKRLNYFPNIMKVKKDDLFELLDNSGMWYSRKGNIVEVRGDDPFTLILWEDVVYH